jgi:hypothetical protein
VEARSLCTVYATAELLHLLDEGGRLGTSTSFLIWAGATMALGATVWTTKITEAKLPPSTD